jgi:topoisomerase-4 subunit A
VVFRLNTEDVKVPGQFKGDDRILVVTKDGYYSRLPISIGKPLSDNILLIEQYDPESYLPQFSGMRAGFYYLKRFEFEDTRGESCFISEGEGSKLGCFQANGGRNSASFMEQTCRPPRRRY